LKWTKRKAIRKFSAIMLAWLMVISSFAPQLVFAEEGIPNYFSEEELHLEKEREKEYVAGNPPQENTDPAEEPETDGGELVDLLKGLGIDPPELEGTSEKQAPTDQNAVLQKAFEKQQEVNVIIRMKDKPDINKIYPQIKTKNNRTEKIKAIQKHLKEKTKNSQKGLEQALTVMEGNGKAKKKESLWIINGLTATITKEAYEELSKREDIAEITMDETLSLPEVTVGENPPRLPQWGLEKIFAPKVWGQYGLKGEGIVVGIMDSGVDGNHEALKQNYRGRDGSHQYSWIDLSGQKYQTPNDGNGHGTHVAGTAVGGGAGEPIGVAPGAEWIAAKIFNDGGSTTLSAIHQAFQWFMAPGDDPSKAPHVVNNSWGNANTYNLEFYEDVKAWVAADIFPSFAAGNDGPGSQTIGSPGSFPEAFAVGATDSYDQTASFSSRGPVYWKDENGQEQRLIKPDISAPGHKIYSAWPAKRNEGKYNTISGTSMATPHVTGAIALLYQANPNMTIEEVKLTLKRTARVEPHMGSLPNDSYGSGIMNIYQAVTETAFAGELKGRLSNKNGKPLAGKLEIISEGLSFDITKEGQFSFKVREGTHKIKVSSFGYKTFETSVTLKIGEALSVDWVLEDAPAYSVKGKLTDETGSPVPYAFIRVKGTTLEPFRTDSKGSFEISDLPEGNYQLQVSGEGITGTSQGIDVKADFSIELKVKKSTASFNKEWGMANGNIHRNAVSSNAIDLKSLEKGWDYDAISKGKILFSTPAAAEGKIVLVTDNGYVVALDSATGKEQWSARIGGSNRSSPTIVENTVYLSGGEDGKIYALDLKSGSIKWTSLVGSLAIYESPIYLNGTLFVASDLTDAAKLTALDAETGKKNWSVALGAPTYFGPSIGDGLLFIGSYDNQTLRALSAEDGTEVWSKKLINEGVASKPVYNEGILYLAGTNFNTESGTLYALDAKTGEEKWKAAGIGDTQAGSPIVYENIVVIGSAAQPALRAFDANTGQELWTNRSVGTALNSGSISANGLLFFAGTSGNLSVIDVYSGERLKDFSLPVYSTSGIPLLPGQVIVPYQTGIQSYQSPGILKGTIKDGTGKPVKGIVTVAETGAALNADEQGHFDLAHSPGEYTVSVSFYGKKQMTEKAAFVSGYVQERQYQLEDAETGSITVTVKDKRTGKPLEGTSIELKSTPIKGSTSNTGIFSAENVFEGTYKAEFYLNGYTQGNSEITVKPGLQNEFTFELQPIDIAVLNDYKSEITNLLNVNGYIAEERDWDVIKDIGRYRVLYLNGGYGSDGVKPTEEQFTELIDQANNNNVSIIFTDQWGQNYGSIHHLSDIMKDPKELGHDYDGGEVRIEVVSEHPILKGYKTGDRVNVLEHNADFAWFNQYSGRTIAKIGNTKLGFVGSGIAYNAVSEKSAHLLLSSHATVPWESSKAWLRGQQQILLNSVDYLYNAKFGEITGTVVNSSGQPVEASVEVLETGVKTTTGTDGKFAFFHDEGTFKLEVRAKGLGVKTENVEIVNGTPVDLSISLGESEKGSLSGAVTDAVTGMELQDVLIAVKNENGEIVSEVHTGANGRYEITGLAEEVYDFSFTKEDYISKSQKIDVARHTGDLDIQLHTMPAVGVVGDYYASDKNFKALLKEIGITAVDVQPADLAERMSEFDVVFLNEPSSSFTKTVFDDMMKAADLSETSLIFGDAVWSGSGINQLVKHRQDPKERNTIRKTTASAQYKILKEHPIFSNAKADELIEILTPAASYVGYFKDYSGYPLAEIKHEDSDTSHGLGIAYKPRTSGSVELLLSGHGFTYYHGAKDYTEEAKQILINSVLWAADVKFPVINGRVLDEDGNPLKAEIKVKGQPFSTESSSEDGSFSIALLAGDYEIELRAYGYSTKTINMKAALDNEPQTISMDVANNVGTISGTVENEKDGIAIEGAKVTLLGNPREAATTLQGQFHLDKIEPGQYTVRVEKDGYVRKDAVITISENEKAVLNVKLLPTPTIGLIVDLTASGTTFKQYLEERGYKVVSMNYKDLEKLAEVDVVFANSDYAPSLVPTKAEFLAFQKELDEQRLSVIWTGQAGGRGSIRYLQEYMNDPTTLFEDNNSPGAVGTVLGEHPLTSGFKKGEVIQIPGKSGYYYGFDGYSGKTIVDFSHNSTGEKGSMVAYKGRTTDSVEILLANMTISHVFKPGESFDPAREQLLNNALSWVLTEKQALVGEVHGTIKNENGPVAAAITVKETGRTYTTAENGMFFAALEEGTYTLRVNAFGHQPKDFTVTVQNGEQLEGIYTIESVNSGVLSGSIKDAATKDPIPNASIEVLGTPVTAKTDNDGNYQLTLPDGAYDIKVLAEGYTPIYLNAEIVAGQPTILDAVLVVSDKIAVLANTYNKDRILPFLQQNGYDPDFYPYGDYEALIEQIPDYKLLIVNDTSGSMSDERFRAMVEKANENEVSMIFTSQYGFGSIGDLKDAYGDPESYSSGYADKEINIQINEDHPIFRGFNKGDTVPFLVNSKGSVQYSIFQNYSGTTIGSLVNPIKGDLGSSIGYKFSSTNSVHILLGSLQIGSYGNPNDRWTENTKTIYLNAIDFALTASQGEIKGSVTDTQGKPVAGALVSIEGTSLKTTTNASGQYRIGIGVGEYQVKVKARGYAEQVQAATVADLGNSAVINFTLEAIEGADLKGMISGKKGKEPVSAAALTLIPVEEPEFKMEAVSTENGTFHFENLLPGSYTLIISAQGYLPQTFDVEIGQEDQELNLELNAYEAAVIGDFDGTLTNLLNQHQIYAEDRDWDVLGSVGKYKLILVNSKNGTKEQVQQLISESDKHKVSLVFTSTWGVNDGSIQTLKDVLGSPDMDQQGYNEGAVYIKENSEHPIFSGIEADENGLVRIHAEKSPYATFKNYTGIPVAGLFVGEESKGESIGFEFRSHEHMHLLMSTFAVNNMIGPDYGWTDEGKQLFVNALRWSMEAEQQTPSEPLWDQEEVMVKGEPAILTGKADLGTTVNVYEQHGNDFVLLGSVKTTREGTFSIELDLANGNHNLIAETENFAGKTVSKNVMKLIVTGKPEKKDKAS
jgi:outer membrane protein assembly factor BamB/subtilisin family serine protease/5-hydroxyisourate hydrolase-like protein (transthyretin family)